MAELKTKLNNASVDKFLKGVKDEQARADCLQIMEMMKKASKAEPKMWGTSIVGFGEIHLKYASGRELDWFPIGFSPRKQNLTLYFNGGLEPHQELLKKLGKHTTGKGCLYIKKLEDVDTKVLQKMIANTVKSQPKKKA
jgi:hypothetical protein